MKFRYLEKQLQKILQKTCNFYVFLLIMREISKITDSDREPHRETLVGRTKIISSCRGNHEVEQARAGRRVLGRHSNLHIVKSCKLL